VQPQIELCTIVGLLTSTGSHGFPTLTGVCIFLASNVFFFQKNDVIIGFIVCENVQINVLHVFYLI